MLAGASFCHMPERQPDPVGTPGPHDQPVGRQQADIHAEHPQDAAHPIPERERGQDPEVHQQHERRAERERQRRQEPRHVEPAVLLLEEQKRQAPHHCEVQELDREREHHANPPVSGVPTAIASWWSGVGRQSANRHPSAENRTPSGAIENTAERNCESPVPRALVYASFNVQSSKNRRRRSSGGQAPTRDLLGGEERLGDLGQQARRPAQRRRRSRPPTRPHRRAPRCATR